MVLGALGNGLIKNLPCHIEFSLVEEFRISHKEEDGLAVLRLGMTDYDLGFRHGFFPLNRERGTCCHPLRLSPRF